MNLEGKKFVLIGGAGLIGSHTADHLIKEDVKEIIIYDNMVRGNIENLAKISLICFRSVSIVQPVSHDAHRPPIMPVNHSHLQEGMDL